MLPRARSALLAPALAACGGSTPPPESAATQAVVVSEAAAPASYVALRALTVTSGKGCGFFGEAGSREGAELLLRREAGRLGATYVQVTSFEAPKPNHQCLEHEYKLSGLAFRAPGSAPPASASALVPAAPSAQPPVSASATSTAAAPSHVCIPGATQACLGPGACQGAQACRDDASGFLPCDCGPSPKP